MKLEVQSRIQSPRITPTSEGNRMSQGANTSKLANPPPSDNPDSALRQTSDVDYVLVGNSCWIESGEFVLYIRKNDGGSLTAELYRENKASGQFDELGEMTSP